MGKQGRFPGPFWPSCLPSLLSRLSRSRLTPHRPTPPAVRVSRGSWPGPTAVPGWTGPLGRPEREASGLPTQEVAAAPGRGAPHPAALVDGDLPPVRSVLLQGVGREVADLHFVKMGGEVAEGHPARRRTQCRGGYGNGAPPPSACSSGRSRPPCPPGLGRLPVWADRKYADKVKKRVRKVVLKKVKVQADHLSAAETITSWEGGACGAGRRRGVSRGRPG